MDMDLEIADVPDNAGGGPKVRHVANSALDENKAGDGKGEDAPAWKVALPTPDAAKKDDRRAINRTYRPR